MLLIRSFIDLIVMPVISLHIWNKKANRELTPTFDNFIRYSIFIPCNIPVTRLFTFVVRKTIGINIEADSSYYTVFALMSALLLPSLIILVQKICIELSANEEN